MKILLSLVLLLAACGTQKFAPELSEQNGGASGGPCPKHYEPIPIVRPEGGSLIQLESLPDGRYASKDVDYYLHKEDLQSFEIHFREEINNMGLFQKRICASSVEKKLVFQAGIETVGNYLNPPNGTQLKGYTTRAFSVRADQGKLLTDVTVDRTLRAGDFAPILTKFQQTRIYQLDQNTYEIRAQSREVIDGSVVTKRLRETLTRAPY